MADKIKTDLMLEDGTDGALHDAILGDREAGRRANEMAVKRAIAEGMDPERAKRLFGK